MCDDWWQNTERGYECLIHLTSPPVHVPARRQSSTLIVCQPAVVSDPVTTAFSSWNYFVVERHSVEGIDLRCAIFVTHQCTLTSNAEIRSVMRCGLLYKVSRFSLSQGLQIFAHKISSKTFWMCALLCDSIGMKPKSHRRQWVLKWFGTVDTFSMTTTALQVGLRLIQWWKRWWRWW